MRSLMCKQDLWVKVWHPAAKPLILTEVGLTIQRLNIQIYLLMQITCWDRDELILNLTGLHISSSPNDKSSSDSFIHNPAVVTSGWSTTLVFSWSARDCPLCNSRSAGVAKSNGFYLCWSSLDRFLCVCTSGSKFSRFKPQQFMFHADDATVMGGWKCKDHKSIYAQTSPAIILRDNKS